MANVQGKVLARYFVREEARRIEERAQTIAIGKSVEMPLEALRDPAILHDILAEVRRIENRSNGGFAVTVALAASIIGEEAANSSQALRECLALRGHFGRGRRTSFFWSPLRRPEPCDRPLPASRRRRSPPRRPASRSSNHVCPHMERTSDVVGNLATVREKIANAALQPGRSRDEIRLILVTKTIAAETIREVCREHADLGENKVQEGLRKAEILANESIRWSMIGHLQSNKVKDVLRFASEVQSLDRLSLATALEKRLQHLGHGLDVLVQVNTSGEASKYGLSPEDVPAFLTELTAFDALRLRGFMTLATFTSDEDEVRRCFRVLRHIRVRAQQDAPQGSSLADLSMGMSCDDQWAIEEGVTVVRVGQVVFGPRRLPDSHYWPGAAGTKCHEG